MTEAKKHEHPPHFFQLKNGEYWPTGLARSPWDRQSVAGGPIAAILAHGGLDPVLEEDFTIARMTVDIFGKVPFAPISIKVDVLRDGRQTKLHRITLYAANKAVAQAHLLRVRRLETPQILPDTPYPSLASLGGDQDSQSFGMLGAFRIKFVEGAVGVPGRAVAWTSMEAEIVLGHGLTTFERAAMFSDYGNGFGNATYARDWSFANLDITMQFLRMPRGSWMLIDAETHMAGDGHGTVRNIFADEDGIFARGFQTIFVAPGYLSEGLPPNFTAEGVVKN
jgi:hypothetical protein